MKIYIKVIRVFLWINFFLWVSVSTLSAKLQQDDLGDIKKRLGIGINISLFEHYWTSPQVLLKEDISQKIKNISDAGFKTVRLPIAFDIFTESNSFNLQSQIIDKIKEIYAQCTAQNLNLILTYHYGKLNDSNTFSQIERISWIWKQVQRRFTGQGYSTLFFELYNEPVMSGNLWKSTITEIIQNLRYEDPNRIYIVGATNYNSLDDLMAMGKLPDNKILYTFHFYEPFIFTHQGADWTDNKTYVQNLPYPYRRNKMPNPYASNAPKRSSTAYEDLTQYPFIATNEFIAYRLKAIASFCSKNNMPLICTETGVIKLADDKSRKRYLEDVIFDMHDLRIPAVLWDYDDKFSIKKNEIEIEKYLHKWLMRFRN
ncbi:MAG: cellulase family glycosylhydrolase [Bacteroidota bacterium]|nr:cellulase family glycosylhydrolase [Bacteroidota bacterium]